MTGILSYSFIIILIHIRIINHHRPSLYLILILYFLYNKYLAIRKGDGNDKENNKKSNS